MSNFKFEVKLEQHTPMIHFQKNASLRATELKPKLDKFLKSKHIDLPFSDHNTLDYKVKISAKIENENIESPSKKPGGRPVQFPMFFANMGDDGEDKIFSLTKDIIKIEFFSFQKQIIKAIKNNFADFLLKTNFGTRQSKGFGSFYIHPDDTKYYKEPKLKYKFTVKKNDIRTVFEQIELFYKTLRSGLNEYRGPKKGTILYFKSLMFLYAKNKENQWGKSIQWDKKSIKEVYFKKQLSKDNKKHNYQDILNYSSDDKKLMRDLLGLSCSEQWGNPYKTTINKEDKNQKIERYKSPVIFKPFKNKNNGFDVHFYAEKTDPNFLGNWFSIKTGDKGELQLQTPTKFDVDKFLDFALSVDLDSHVDSKFHGSSEFQGM